MSNPEKPPSRQAVWRASKLALGMCVQCGKRHIHEQSKSRCWLCCTKDRTRQRKRAGGKPGCIKIKRPTFDCKHSSTELIEQAA